MTQQAAQKQEKVLEKKIQQSSVDINELIKRIEPFIDAKKSIEKKPETQWVQTCSLFNQTM